MKGPDLLLWMSARRAGSWQQFKDAVEELHLPEGVAVENETAIEPDIEYPDHDEHSSLPLYQLLRLNLERLGHAEFFSPGCENGWRVAPPVLAVSDASQQGTGLLCGARTSAIVSRFLDRQSMEFQVRVTAQEQAPDRVAITGESVSSLLRAAEDLGVTTQMYAPLAILTALPPVDNINSWKHAELPYGALRTERFEAQQLTWRTSTREDAPQRSGLYRFHMQYGPDQYFISHKQLIYRVPAGVGRYFALHRQRKTVVQYDSARRQLRIPARCRPPMLIERSLVLCSGVVPHFNSLDLTLCYEEIPQGIARLTLQLLRQEHG